MILRELIASFGVEVDQASLAKVEAALTQVQRRAQVAPRTAPANAQNTQANNAAANASDRAERDSSRAADAFRQRVAQIGSTIATAFSVGVFSRFLLGMSEAGEEIDNTSQALGLSASALTEWRFIGDQAGVSAEQLTAGLSAFSRQVGGAASGNSAAAANFRSLGISIRGANGEVRPTSELFEEVGLALAAMPPGAQRSAAAMRLLGRSGALLLPAFSDGAEGIERARETVRAFTGGELEQFVNRSKELNERMDVFKLGLEAIKVSIFLAAAPALEWLVTKITAGFRAFQEFTRGTQFVKVALVALGGVAVAFGASTLVALAPILLMAAAFATVVLVVDDLLTFLRGGKSVIGTFLDTLFGLGTGAKVVRMLGATVDTLKAAFASMFAVASPGLDFLVGQIADFDRRANAFFASPAGRLLMGLVGSPLMAALEAGAGLTPQNVVDAGRNQVRGDGSGALLARPNAGFNAVTATTNATINVSGAENPDETARAMRKALQEREESTAREAHGALVPRGA